MIDNHAFSWCACTLVLGEVKIEWKYFCGIILEASNLRQKLSDENILAKHQTGGESGSCCGSCCGAACKKERKPSRHTPGTSRMIVIANPGKSLHRGKVHYRFSISFSISCFEKCNFFLLFQRLSLKLIGNCTSGSASYP